MRDIIKIIKFTKSLWRYYLAISIFTILLAGMSQLQPLFVKGAIDQITNVLHGHKVNIGVVAMFAIFIFITDLGTTFFSNISGYLGDILAVKLQQFMSEKYFEHLLDLTQSYFDSELTGTIINRMNRGIGQISQFINILSNNFLQFIFSTIFSLAIVYYFSWQVGLMLTAIYPVFIYMTKKTSKKWQTYQKDINKEQDIASGRFAEAIGQIKVVKSFLQERRELSIFSRHFAKSVTTTYPQSRLWHKQDISRRLILNVIFMAIYVYIFVETARGVYGLGTMVLLIQYAQLIRIPIFSISFLVDQTQRAISNTKDYFDAIDIEADIVDPVDAIDHEFRDGKVLFKDVKFSYDNKKMILKGLSFKLDPNTKTALVGESGEGKTTITNLMLRLYEPQSGEIEIDGQNIAKITQKSLRSQIAVVFQEPALFSGSIKANIAYGTPSAKLKDIKEAARLANANEFIDKLENAYDTEIGERGLKLSGGQKQRIAIARALLKNAPILILDEATSSLDSRSERLVQEALDNLMANRTTLIIAHRLSTIQSVDQIVTIKGGIVDEAGTPSELESSGGIYDQLLKLQRGHNDKTKEKLKEYGIKQEDQSPL